jgi:hypothetical protein
MVSNASAAESAAKPFDSFEGWETVPMTFELGQVQSQFTSQKRPFSFKVFRGDSSPYITLTSGKSTVTMTFSLNDSLEQVLVQSPVIQDETVILNRVGGAMERFGAPHETLEKEREESAKTVVNYIWRNAQVELTLTVVHYTEKGYWLVWEEYIPAKPVVEVQSRTAEASVSSTL